MYVTQVPQKKPTAAVMSVYPDEDVLEKEACFPAVDLQEVQEELYYDQYFSSEPSVCLQNLTENQRLNYSAMLKLTGTGHVSTAKLLPNGFPDEDEPWD